MLLKIVLAAAPFALIALSALPRFIIQRRARRLDGAAVDEYRDALPVDEPIAAADTAVDLDTKWSTYWSNSRAADNALLADLNDYVGWTSALEERFTLDCDRVIKRFVIDATLSQAATASAFGGWSSDVDRTADLIIESVGGSLAALNHDLRVEVAECTETRWTKRDGELLAEYIDTQEVRS